MTAKRKEKEGKWHRHRGSYALFGGKGKGTQLGVPLRKESRAADCTYSLCSALYSRPPSHVKPRGGRRTGAGRRTLEGLQKNGKAAHWISARWAGLVPGCGASSCTARAFLQRKSILHLWKMRKIRRPENRVLIEPAIEASRG